MALTVRQPFDEGLSRKCLLSSLHYSKNEFLLILLAKANISPMTDVSSENSCLFALSHSLENGKSIHFETMVALSLKVGLAPSVEELGLHLLVGIISHQVLVFVVLVDEIHGVSVPSPQSIAFALRSVLSHYFYKFVDSLFEILHIFGAAFDLLQGVLGSQIKRLAENLEKKLSSQESDMSLVRSDDLLPLRIHALDVVFVPVVKVIHLADEIISFIGQSPQIIFKPPLLGL